MKDDTISAQLVAPRPSWLASMEHRVRASVYGGGAPAIATTPITSSSRYLKLNMKNSVIGPLKEDSTIGRMNDDTARDVLDARCCTQTSLFKWFDWQQIRNEKRSRSVIAINNVIMVRYFLGD